MKNHFHNFESLPYKISDNPRIEEKEFEISGTVGELIEELYFEVGKGVRLNGLSGPA